MLYIFAGANGVGKTTMAEYFMTLPGVMLKEFVNADEIAKGLSPFNPDGQKLEAGKLVHKRIGELLDSGVDFAIETTLSGKGHLRIIDKARDAGYEIYMIYCYSDNVEVNVRRVRNRVIEGGHNVPESDIRRRYSRSLSNLMNEYWDMCNFISVYDMTTITEDMDEVQDVCIKMESSPIEVYNERIWQKLQSYKNEENNNEN